ncbi:MAG TPA: hypothetical protein VHO03_12345 [Ignavibacteriales bacterium]|nr:hypothetical protein [Ignavibacteriales bacterium]
MTNLLKSIEETCGDINTKFSSVMKNIDDEYFDALVFMAKKDISFRNMEILEGYLLAIQNKLFLINSFLKLMEQASNNILDIDSLLSPKKNTANKDKD